MRLLFKQKFTFGFDRFDIYDEAGDVAYSVQSRFAFGRKLEVYDRSNQLAGVLIGKVFTFLPTFEIHIGGERIGSIKKKFTLFKPEFEVDCNGWSINGDFFGWNYELTDADGIPVGRVIRELAWTDTYTLDIYNDVDVLTVLMIIIAIDAEKDNRSE